MGGKRTLSIGSVCQDCNEILGQEVDRYLKIGNFMMMLAYQKAPGIPGKIRNKKDRERKEAEKQKITAYHGGTYVERTEESVNLVNIPGGSETGLAYDKKFSRALHKCVANVLCDQKGADYVAENHLELCRFVRFPEDSDYQDWSYAVCYANMFSNLLFEPFSIKAVETELGKTVGCVLAFPSAMYVVGSVPKVITNDLISQFAIEIELNTPLIEVLKEQSLDFLAHFDSTFDRDRKDFGRHFFGKNLRFYWLKYEVEGTWSPLESFYLLSNCRFCGQTNPTGLMVNRENIFSGDHTKNIDSPKNTWNRYFIEDFPKKGFDVDKWKPSVLQELIDTQGINYPVENDVKKMNIFDCRYVCLNCNLENTYNASDCFL